MTLPDRDGPALRAWAERRGLRFQARPDEEYFRRWEPYDTLAPPTAYVNACTLARSSREYVVLVEPWYGGELDSPLRSDPLDRTVFAFASDPRLLGRAAARVGEHFATRVVYLESAPPPRVLLGDPLWDEHVHTVGRSEDEVRRAFHAELRGLLARRGFRGHLELRGGGMVVFCAGLPPTAGGYEELLARTQEILGVAVTGSAARA